MRLLPRSIHADKLESFSNFVFNNAAAVANRGRWGDFFRDQMGKSFDGRIILDVGCFDASFLIGIARKNPRSAFVGLDWKCKPLCDGAETITGMELKNVSLLRARGSDIAHIFGAGELDEVWVFHPELCAEEESHSRLLDARFLHDVHATLRDESSVFAFKTDHRDHFDWMVTRCGQHFVIAMQSNDYWNDSAALADATARLFSGELTKYERRFVKKRRPIYYVEMRKKRRSAMAAAVTTSADMAAAAEGVSSAAEGAVERSAAAEGSAE